MALEKQASLSLQPSEAIVVRAAADIYAAYIIAGKVKEGQEKTWRDRAIREAFDIAKTADDAIRSDGEMS